MSFFSLTRGNMTPMEFDDANGEKYLIQSITVQVDEPGEYVLHLQDSATHLLRPKGGCVNNTQLYVLNEDKLSDMVANSVAHSKTDKGWSRVANVISWWDGAVESNVVSKYDFNYNNRGGKEFLKQMHYNWFKPLIPHMNVKKLTANGYEDCPYYLHCYADLLMNSYYPGVLISFTVKN